MTKCIFEPGGILHIIERYARFSGLVAPMRLVICAPQFWVDVLAFNLDTTDFVAGLKNHLGKVTSHP
jgi:hypothetical protein